MGNTTQPTKIMTITPERAASWLRRQELLVASNPLMRNRTVKEDKVRLYARDMSAGKWQVNGEPIIFASNGRILDGQHRLLACVQAEASFRTHVVENVPHDAMETIDTGIMRTMGDQLTIAGKSSGTRLATALAVLWRWEQTGHKGFDWRARPTRAEQFDCLERHPSIEEYVQRANRLENLMSAGLGAGLWYIFARQDTQLADLFFESLISGASMAENDPVFVLRERLIRERHEAAQRRSKKWMTMDITTELVTRAWDATKRGIKLTKIQRARRDLEKPMLQRRLDAGTIKGATPSERKARSKAR